MEFLYIYIDIMNFQCGDMMVMCCGKLDGI
jgi:hypothetical protein